MPTVQEVLTQAWNIHQQGNYQAAEQVYRSVLEHVPTSASAWCYLGIVLFDQRRFADSERCYREAIKLQPVFPIAWNNLGNTLRMLAEIELADQAFDTALKQDPNYLSPLKNRGTLWVWTGELDRAISAFNQGLAVAPNDPEIHRNLGVIYLLLGRFEEGWREYRYRWQMPGFVRPLNSQPVWNGCDPAGKTLLLYPAQGLGDTIHFIRMCSELKQRGAQTIVQVPAKLVPLLSACDGIDQLIVEGQTPPLFDYHCSFIDAADLLRVNAENITSSDAYVFVDPNLQTKWKSWVSAATDKKRVGICWQGNPDHQADVFRSIPLTHFESLADCNSVQLFCLQFGFGLEQLDSSPLHDRVLRLPEGIDQQNGAFCDTAAVVKQLDLVITSDTSMAHLAGAIGVPVWVALPHVPDWRWLLERDTTPWYPSMRLYRQPKMKDWMSVFAEIRRDLEAI